MPRTYTDDDDSDQEDLSIGEQEEESEKDRLKRERVAEAREKLALMMKGKKGAAGGDEEQDGRDSGYQQRDMYKERIPVPKRADKHA